MDGIAVVQKLTRSLRPMEIAPKVRHGNMFAVLTVTGPEKAHLHRMFHFLQTERLQAEVTHPVPQILMQFHKRPVTRPGTLLCFPRETGCRGEGPGDVMRQILSPTVPCDKMQ